MTHEITKYLRRERERMRERESESHARKISKKRKIEGLFAYERVTEKRRKELTKERKKERKRERE